jgi:hypothetical protein
VDILEILRERGKNVNVAVTAYVSTQARLNPSAWSARRYQHSQNPHVVERRAVPHTFGLSHSFKVAAKNSVHARRTEFVHEVYLFLSCLFYHFIAQ